MALKNMNDKMVCKICGNSENNKLYEAKEMMFGFKGKFYYFQCPDCGCLQILEIPLDMAEYYPSNYYSFFLKLNDLKKSENRLMQFLKDRRNDYAIFNRGMLGRMIYRKLPAEWVREDMSLIFPGMPPSGLVTKKSRILDIGCGNGNTLYFLKELGFNNLLGIDPYVTANIKHPNGLKILKKSIHELDGQFDLIMFHHSFEHMRDPLETLQSVSRLLTKAGKCLIRIPTVDSYAWQYYRQNWVALDPPRHFYLHSIKSMKILSDKAGLDIMKVVYDSTDMQFWGSEQYLKNIPLMSDMSYGVNKQRSIFREDEIRVFKKEARRLNSENKGDCAAFYLERC
jgi:SAM-dependent methyltransferase